MACTFEQVGKGVRIEIPSPVSRFTSLVFATHFYGAWCFCSLGAILLWNSQGAEIDALPSLLGAMSGLTISIIGRWKENSDGSLLQCLGYFTFYAVIVAIGAFLNFAFWPPEGAFVLNFSMLIVLAAIIGINIAQNGFRDELDVCDEKIEVVRSWLNLYFQRFSFERCHSDIDFEWRSTVSSKTNVIPELVSVLLFDGARVIRLGQFQSESDLRRLHALLQPNDVINGGDGIWEFSDPHLRRISKSKVTQAC